MKRDLQKFSSELRMQLQNGLQLLKRSGSLEPEDLVWLKRQKQVASAVASAQAKILPSERGRSVREVRSATIGCLLCTAADNPYAEQPSACLCRCKRTRNGYCTGKTSRRKRKHSLLQSAQVACYVSEGGRRNPRVLLVVPSFEGHKADKLLDVVGGRWHNYGLRVQVSQSCRHADIKDISIGA